MEMTEAPETREIPEVNQLQLPSFPADVWTEIAQWLEDPSQILNMVKGIPEMEAALKEDKFHWLFLRVLPQVSKWLTKNELLSCRQVCRQWSRAVDSFEQNHPYLRAYRHPDQHVTIQYDELKDDNYLTGGLKQRGMHVPPFYFPSVQDINNFLQTTETCPPGRNPFLNRAVRIESSTDLEVLTGAIQIFRRFGHHIWFLSVADVEHRDVGPFSTAVMEWLHHLPNLKCLMLRAPLMNGRQHWAGQLPPLPQLESLRLVPNLPLVFAHRFLSSVSRQIRRLYLDMKYWKRGFATAFPNVTELGVLEPPTLEAMTELLLSIQAPRLHLLLTSKLSSPATATVSWAVLIRSLQRFPVLRYLTLPPQLTVVGNEGVFIPEIDSIPAVKSLQIGGACLSASPDFLGCFRNLEYLHVSASPPPITTTTGRPSLSSRVNIWDPLINSRIYDSNVWQLLPKLKAISVAESVLPGQEAAGASRFNRETYDDHQRKVAAAGGAEATPTPSDLFRNISDIF